MILTVVTLTFFLIRLVPGGPFDDDREVPEEKRQTINKYYGFDKPVMVQHYKYMENLSHSDTGTIYKYPY
jgi:oligopeptide transport system permease protein